MTISQHNDQLSESEVEDITGLNQAAAQLRFLKDKGIHCFLNKKGKLIVTWHAVHHPNISSANNEEEEDESYSVPKFSALT